MTAQAVCVRAGLTAALVAVCLFLCLGFWLTTSEWDPVILGRYSLKWFAGSLAVSAVLVLSTFLVLRAVWSPRDARDGDRDGVDRLSLRKRLLFGAAIVLPGLMGVEAGLRYFDVVPKPRDPLSIAGTEYHYHALLQQVDRIEQGGKLVRAYRGQAYDPVKTTRFRVLCLGGSTTWGHRLPREDTWPSILEKLLREMGYDVEIINAARPWYTTAHSLVNYCLQMRRYNPDVVVIMHGVNDLVRSFPGPGEPGIEWDYGSYQGPMRSVLDAYGRKRDPFRPLELLANTAIWRLVCQGTALDRKFYGDLRGQPGGNRAPDVEVGLDGFPTLETFQSHLAYLTRLCLDDGRRVLLSTQAHAYSGPDLSILDGLPEVARREFLRDAGGTVISRESLRRGMRAVRNVILQVAGRQGVPVADPERAVDGRLDYFMDDFHLNPSGNAVAAGAFVDVLAGVLDERRTWQARAKPNAVPARPRDPFPNRPGGEQRSLADTRGDGMSGG